MSEITDEMVKKAIDAWPIDPPFSPRNDMRAALEAVAPLIRAQGMREAGSSLYYRLTETWKEPQQAQRDIYARAAELEEATPNIDKMTDLELEHWPIVKP